MHIRTNAHTHTLSLSHTHMHTHTLSLWQAMQDNKWEFVEHADLLQVPRDALGVEHGKQIKMLMLQDVINERDRELV